MDVEIIAYRYGLQPPLDWGDEIEAAMQRQVDLWNRLVEIEREYRGGVREIVASEANLELIQAERVEVLQDLRQLIDQRSATRSKARRRTTTPDLDSCIAATRKRLQEVTERAKAARAPAYTRLRLQLRELEDKRVKRVKEARQAAAAGGLWWGNYNAMIDSYEVARRGAIREGRKLRFKRFTGEGRLTNQIIGGMSVVDLMSGTKAQISVGPVTRRRGRDGHVELRTLTATVYNDVGLRRTATWPIVMHRSLPVNARVQTISVHRVRQADRWRWHAVIVLRQLRARGIPRGEVVAINLGWRKTAAGIRVATVLRSGNDEPEFIYLPARLIAGIVEGDRAHSRLDRKLNAMAEWLRALDLCDGPEQVTQAIVTAREKTKLRPRHLEWLRSEWENHSERWRPHDLGYLQEFGRLWRRHWRSDAARRRWLINARRDHYRCETKRLIGDAEKIVINSHDLPSTIRASKDESPPAVRRQQAMAARAELRSIIENYSRRTGTSMVVREIAHDLCAHCGEPLGAQNRSELVWKCRSCETRVDQDENFCRLMLAAEVSDPNPGAAVHIPEMQTDSMVYRWNRKRSRGRTQLSSDSKYGLEESASAE